MKWIIKEKPDQELSKFLSEKLNIPHIISQILINRNINTVESIKKFFNTKWDDLYDPFLMLDMDRAATRVVQAIERGERILIHGDYDVDGITAVSILYLFLKRMGSDVFFYIPDRLKEGYGLSRLGVQKAYEVEARLLITADCGITNVEEVDLANKFGIDVIISDHHEEGEFLPSSYAILDPKRKGCNYPFKELSGVGVAFKLIHAVIKKLGIDLDILKEYLDLVALGSAADIVPLIDENRLLVKMGLEKINRRERIGIKALIESSGLSNRVIGTGQVVFILAPRINAVGRLGNAERAVRLLVTDSDQQAKNIANILEAENRNRKNIDDQTFNEAIEIIEKEFDSENDRALVLAKEGWHPGVIGIVASRIAERMYRPTIMIAIEDGIGRGSARSILNFDIYSAIRRCERYLLRFGGHKYAAGLMLEIGKIEKFKEDFKKIAYDLLKDEELVQRIIIDAEIELPQVNEELVGMLNRFAPFGPQNMRPVFLSRNLQVVGTPKVVGKDHLKFKVRQGGKVYEAIGFDLGSLHYRLCPGEENLNMVYVIEENFWNGKSRVQLRVKDLK